MTYNVFGGTLNPTLLYYLHNTLLEIHQTQAFETGNQRHCTW